ncbi:PAP2 domain protein [Aspergillus affinis]|uniref:PAP2 domain protein n=1 Tax=Aspergillus affinis TaxID=1070780 RepID=UPI0022FE7B8F|nr:PAP2-domain-containing protein [Aspergillus affinis]KAI9035666.1 PAP2-domain-containing protein [Aspergillus affinis]
MGGKPDAGLRGLNHYQRQLPSWRYWPRQKLLPLVRFETPYLAWAQEKVRTPTLDSYFAFTANLGTHTFFMVFLPILFWSGYNSLGRGMVNLLASGVFFSGFIKDLLCLPRPLSPPLQRITMSGSAALEYGFPSTHSTNAVSVAVYGLVLLNSEDTALSPTVNLILQAITYLYVFSIVIGRLYCGMHGFFDVIVGSSLGALLAFVQHAYGPIMEEYALAGRSKEVLAVVLIILVLVRIHPEPADDCPCFDDSVAFAGVLLGAQAAYWHLALTQAEFAVAPIPYRIENLGIIKTTLRLVIGVLMLFTWRASAKPFLLRILPPVFRGLEKLGLILPRRFFTKASEYTKVPAHLKDHEIIPSFSDIPSILKNIRHPRRRAISVGPQSEADAYETLAYREKRRRESLSNGKMTASVPEETENDHDASRLGATPRLSRKQSKLHEYENMMGTGSPRIATGVDTNSRLSPETEPFPDLEPEPVEPDEDEVFAQIKKPRVRYDVEVITKLVVYSGIAWIAMDWAPLLFEHIGLGPN